MHLVELVEAIPGEREPPVAALLQDDVQLR
jgi:hypothetical protein